MILLNNDYIVETFKLDDCLNSKVHRCFECTTKIGNVFFNKKKKARLRIHHYKLRKNFEFFLKKSNKDIIYVSEINRIFSKSKSYKIRCILKNHSSK